MVNGMELCKRCGAILDEDDEAVPYRRYRELGGMLTTNVEFRVYRLKRKIQEICDELDIPHQIRDAALDVALKLLKHNQSRMKATTISLISILYAIKLSGNIVLYEKMKEYLGKYRGGRCRIGNKKHNILRSIGWREPNIDVIAYLNLIVKRVEKMQDNDGRLDLHYIREVTKKAVEIYAKYRRIFIGKRPSTIATILLYLAEERLDCNSGKRFKRVLTIDLLSQVSGVSQNTIKNRVSQYRRLLNNYSSPTSDT